MKSGKLVVGGKVVAQCERAESTGERMKGLIGRRSLDGAIWLEPATGVHTMFMRIPIEVAFLDAHGNVLRVVRMRRWHTGISMRRARAVVESAVGSMAKFGITKGSIVTYRSLE